MKLTAKKKDVLELETKGFLLRIDANDYNCWADVVKNGKVVGELRINAELEDNKIVAGDKKITLSEEQARKFKEFTATQKLRTLVKFDTFREACDNQTEKTGEIFERDGKHCFYRYTS